MGREGDGSTAVVDAEAYLGIDRAFPLWKPNDAHEDAKWRREVGRALSRVSRFEAKQWAGLSVEDRLRALQALETLLASATDRQPSTVTTALLGKNTDAMYTAKTHTITMNTRILGNRNRTLNRLLHESRHAYQFTALDNPGYHYDAAAVQSWKNSQLLRLVPGSYLLRTYEQDAYLFASRVMTGVRLSRLPGLGAA